MAASFQYHLFFSFLSFLAFWTAIPAAAGDILALRPDHKHFEYAIKGFTETLAGEYTISEKIFDRAASAEDLARILNRERPRLLVLMDNRTVYLYQQYQKQQPEGTRFIPSLIIMAVYADKMISSLKNATGIRYEVQGVTSLVNLRSLVQRPIDRVGVIYRSGLQTFFKEQQVLCLQEKIELVGIMLDHKGKSKRKLIRRGLRRLIRQENIDALWILNDNHLINNKLLHQVWLPELRHSGKPVVAGIENLISEQVGLAHFAVVPDPVLMGVQAAEMVYEISEANWSAEGIRPRMPIGVQKILNMKKLDRSISVNKEAMLELDRVIR